MKLPNLDQAFGDTPECVHAAIEAGFRAGARAEAQREDESRAWAVRAARSAARRRRLFGAAGVAAVLALTLCVAVLSTARPGAPRPDTFHPAAQPGSGSAPSTSGNDPGASTSKRPNPEAEVFVAPGGLYYHAVPDCSGMEGAQALSAGEAAALGKRPCPVCVGATDGGASMDVATDVPTQTPAEAVSESQSSNLSALNEEIHDATPAIPAEEAAEAPTSKFSAPEGEIYEAPPESPAEAVSDAALSVSSVPEGMVYATDGGRYLHALSDCCGMENARAMTVFEALKLGKAVCPNCIDAKAPVYATDGGHYFHVLSDCCGMENARAMTVPEALKLGKATCPNCIGEVAIAFATEGGRYYHTVSDCSGMENARFTTAAAAEAQGKSPCPACAGAGSASASMNAEIAATQESSGTTISISIAPEAESGEEPPGGGGAETHDVLLYVGIDPDMKVYATDEAPRYHADPGCSGMENARAMTVLSALALDKAPCPVCVGASTRVYATGDGSYYHAFPDCSGMENARATTVEIALNAGKAPCPVCVGADDFVYATRGGIYCHTEANCSGMQNAEAMFASRAGLLGKHPCPVCMAQKPELVRTVLFNNALYLSTRRNAADADSPIFYYTANGSWFHLDPECSGMRSAGSHTLRELFKCGKKPCPACFADEAARELYRISAPEGDKDAVLISGFSSVSGCFHRDPTCFGMQMCDETTLADARDFHNLGPCPACLPGLAGESDSIPCVVDADGAYYHLRDDCPRLGGGAQETTRLQAQASGRMHCPECVALSPDGADKFEALFGFGLSEIEAEYSYERTDLRADGAREWYLSDGIAVDSLGLYAPDGAGGGTLSIGYEYDGGVQLWTLPSELFARAGEPLHALYWEYAPKALQECLADSENLEQTLGACRGASLRFDAGCGVTACMLSFGSPGGNCVLGWEADGNGGFQLAYRRCTGEGWTQAALKEKIGS